jgi:hypothetical protein
MKLAGRRVLAWRFGMSLVEGFRLLLGAGTLIFVGFVVIDYLSQLVFIMSF